MRMKAFLRIVAVLLVLAAGCQPREPEGQDATAESAAPSAAAAPDVTAPVTEAAATPAGGYPAPSSTPAAGSQTPTGTPAVAAAVASQQSNWPGIVVDVTEFRRKGSTLTARAVLRNTGSAEAQPDISYKEVYVMDLDAGKKYEVLKDENGNYIAGLRPGWNDRWYQTIPPGQTYTIWMKFPAPPPEVKSVTLQIPNVLPFEDLPIQDS